MALAADHCDARLIAGEFDTEGAQAVADVMTSPVSGLHRCVARRLAGRAYGARSGCGAERLAMEMSRRGAEDPPAGRWAACRLSPMFPEQAGAQ
ncbi:hypothetical protein PAMC26577_37030 [Caballeronia sordidicola]|uniref:Uncharacterized protein n=1 Tax=Caballeronia sordidicola TaxID=196367 RepID=A0A2C9XVP4_CABSO|nr:hypothetical protein PAMC26577_37030 [Caballeronia sordidicola]